MSAEAGADQSGEEPQKTRRVRVRTVGPGDFLSPGYRMMDLPEDTAGQWDDDQWHLSPPGV